MADSKQPADIEQLIERFLANKCTREELNRLSQYLEADPANPALTRVMQSFWEQTQREDTAGIDWDKRFEGMLKEAKAMSPAVVTTQSRSRWARTAWFAAASLVLVILTAQMLWINPSQPEATAAQTTAPAAASPEILPGKNIAVLTLANGSTIILDSARNGTISKQGNTRVVKLANGQVAYDAATATGEISYNKISTPLGGQYEIVLPDGTHVWLNAGSSLYFPTAFTGNRRSVVLTGEGYFEVAKDLRMPFHVTANNMEVEVLGTHFNVNAYTDEKTVSTTLLEGMVRIGSTRAPDNRPLSLLNKPGQQASLGKTGAVSRTDGVDVEAAIAWKNGKFYFNEADIPTMMRQVARWYDVDVRYEGAVPAKRFSGKIDRNINLSELIALLAYAKLHVRLEDKTIIVAP